MSVRSAGITSGSRRPNGCGCCSMTSMGRARCRSDINRPVEFTDTKAYRNPPRDEHRRHGAEGRDHHRHRPDWWRRMRRVGDGVRLHRRQHGRRRRRKNHTRRSSSRSRTAAGHHRVVLRRRADDGGGAVADADGEDQRGAGAARSRPPALYLDPDGSDDRRGDRELRDARRREHRRAARRSSVLPARA